MLDQEKKQVFLIYIYIKTYTIGERDEWDIYFNIGSPTITLLF
jgi:hypothetical protein